MSKATRIIRLTKDTARKFVVDLKQIIHDAEEDMPALETAEQVVGGVLVVVAMAIGIMEQPLAKAISAVLLVVGGKLLHKEGNGEVSDANS